MNKTFLLILLILTCAAASFAQMKNMTSKAAMKSAEMEKALMERENMGWMLLKQKRLDEFGKAFGADSQGVYGAGIMNLSEEMAAFKTVNLDSYSLMNMKAVFPTPETGIVTYQVAAKGMFMGKAFDETWNVSSVWVKRRGDWQIVLHTESNVKMN